MDALEMLERQAGGTEEAGETPPVASVATGYDLVEQALPDSDHKLLARWVQRYKLSDDDPMFGQYLTARVAFASATAAGASAVAVASAVSSIPDTVYQGAVRAGDEVRGVIAHEIRGKAVEAGMALKMLIDSSAKAGASALKTAGDNLETRLGLLPADVEKLVDQKTREGVQVFADAAAIAGAKMAKAASARRFLWSVSGVAGLLIVFTAAGAFIDWEYLSLTHLIAPAPLVQTTGGKNDCGLIPTTGNGKEDVCEIR